MAQRIKGQEVEIIMLVDGAPRENLAFAKSLDFTFLTERKTEGYLGETTNRFDTIFNGVEGKTQHHFDNPEPFNIIRLIINKARRREPGTQFNMRSTLNFPRGQRARLIFRDVEFGALPIGFSSRSDYGSFALDFGCSEAQVLPV
jgi:hypothetical protein